MAVKSRSGPFFKIGLTYKPCGRWTWYEDYKSLNSMVVSYVTDNPDEMKQMEKNMISRYRRLDRNGNLVNPAGDSRCLNRAPGGESGDHGHSPFFVYVVFGRQACCSKRHPRPRKVARSMSEELI